MAEPTTLDRVTKALRQLSCAQEETTDQDLRQRIGQEVSSLSVLALDLEEDMKNERH